MITIIFYNDGYVTKGHSDNLTCSQISAMQYIIEGAILEVDKKAKCKDGGAGTGFTILKAENKIALKLLNRYKKDIEAWLNETVKNNKYKILYKNKKMNWNKLSQEVV